MGAQLLVGLMGWSVALVGISGAVRCVCGPGRGIRGRMRGSGKLDRARAV